MWCRDRNTLQSQAIPCLKGKQILGRPSGSSFLPETGLKKPASGDSPPGRCRPRPPIYIMDVAERNLIEPLSESDLKAKAHFSVSPLPSLARGDQRTSLHAGERPPGRRGSRPANHLMGMAETNSSESLCESDLKTTTHLFLPRLPRFASRPGRLDKGMSLLEHPVAVNMPVLEAPCVPVKPLVGQSKSAGHFVLPEAEEKTSVSGERPPGRQGSRPPNHLMGMIETNIIEPLCESDLKTTTHLSLPRLPSFASRPGTLDKGTSLLEHLVAVNMPVLEAPCVPVQPPVEQSKSAGHFFLPEAEEKTSVSGERPPGRRGSRPPNHLRDMAETNVSKSLCESDLKTTTHLFLPRLPSSASRPGRLDKCTSLLELPVAVNMTVLEAPCVPVKLLVGQNKSAGHFFLPEAKEKTSVSGERPPGRQGSRPPNHLMGMVETNVSEPLCESDLKTTTRLFLPRLPRFASRPVRLDKCTSLLEHPVAVNMPVLEATRVPLKPLAGRQKSVAVARNLMSIQSTFDNDYVTMKRAQPPKETKEKSSVSGERPPGCRGSKPSNGHGEGKRQKV